MAALPAQPRLLALAPPPAAIVLAQAAGKAGFDLVLVTGISDLLARLKGEPWASTLLSLSVDPVDEAIARRVGAEPNAGALLLSARSVSLEGALLTERAGAVAMLHEPLAAEEIEARLREVGEEGVEVEVPPHEEDERPVLIGESPAMSEVFSTIARVAAASTTVLITGESGTGKEVVARTLHWASERKDGPFIAVNCAAIPEQLLESELFGHEKGAFTGAVGRRRGRFERADGGTLFLDEIGDMSLTLQAKVLRAVEERSVEPLGGETPTAVDVRTVAATNQVLSDAISAGRFREDLYYRLAVVEVTVPPLRERGQDVRRLALHFASAFARRSGRPIRAISGRALERLEAYPWPGNVRELRNVMDRAVLLSHGDVIHSSALRLGAGAPHVGPRSVSAGTGGYRATASLAAVEAEHIANVVDSVGGRLSRAARILGIHRNTLARKVREYGITGAPESEGT